jgi:hypothetical protein
MFDVRRAAGPATGARRQRVSLLLLEKVRAKFRVVVGVDGSVGVAAKGVYRVGQARPRHAMGAVNSPRCHLGVDINHPNSGWRQRVKGRAGRDEKGKQRPRLKESQGCLPILTASSHGIRCHAYNAFNLADVAGKGGSSPPTPFATMSATTQHSRTSIASSMDVKGRVQDTSRCLGSWC